MSKLIFNTVIILFYLLWLSGCSTLRTVPHYTIDSPKLYSGTRMNLDTMKQNQDYVLKKYNVEASSHPMLDLPFSFVLDTVVLFPVALPIAMYEAIF